MDIFKLIELKDKINTKTLWTQSLSDDDIKTLKINEIYSLCLNLYHWSIIEYLIFKKINSPFNVLDNIINEINQIRQKLPLFNEYNESDIFNEKKILLYAEILLNCIKIYRDSEYKYIPMDMKEVLKILKSVKN